MRRAALVILLLAVIPVAGCDTTPVSQGAGEGVLIFNVQTSDQQDGADIRIEFTPEPEEFGAITWAGGSVTYREFPVGEYVASVTAPGYETLEVDVRVVEGQTSEHDVMLKPEGT